MVPARVHRHGTGPGRGDRPGGPAALSASGCTSPHLWLTPEGPEPQPGGGPGPGRAASGRSTLDACGEWFTLLTPDPARWERFVTGPWPVRVEHLPEEHAVRWGLGPHGALLVRPDGHIAVRRDGPPRQGDTELRAALAAITRPTPP
ncbi:hypothetical protein [Streptomyces sp. NPDC017941]|uniref:aromatic-ring hydroxylase C-terminal domain-containing protein n=1 Tax=unclassified Streptomyces TaxID=2593676 RepID=UPI0037A8A8EE